MNNAFAMGAETIVFLLLAVVYVAGKKYIERNERRKRPRSDEELLSALAADRGCSEFDLFRLAGAQWRRSESLIDEEFKTYLTDGLLPHYVRDYIRKNKPAQPARHSDRNPPGGDLPASWSA